MFRGPLTLASGMPSVFPSLETNECANDKKFVYVLNLTNRPNFFFINHFKFSGDLYYSSYLSSVGNNSCYILTKTFDGVPKLTLLIVGVKVHYQRSPTLIVRLFDTVTDVYRKKTSYRGWNACISALNFTVFFGSYHRISDKSIK